MKVPGRPSQHVNIVIRAQTSETIFSNISVDRATAIRDGRVQDQAGAGTLIVIANSCAIHGKIVCEDVYQIHVRLWVRSGIPEESAFDRSEAILNVSKRIDSLRKLGTGIIL